MKHKYLCPEVEITLLEADDILLASEDLENEVEIDGEGLFD